MQTKPLLLQPPCVDAQLQQQQQLQQRQQQLCDLVQPSAAAQLQACGLAQPCVDAQLQQRRQQQQQPTRLRLCVAARI